MISSQPEHIGELYSSSTNTGFSKNVSQFFLIVLAGNLFPLREKCFLMFDLKDLRGP